MAGIYSGHYRPGCRSQARGDLKRCREEKQASNPGGLFGLHMGVSKNQGVVFGVPEMPAYTGSVP